MSRAARAALNRAGNRQSVAIDGMGLPELNTYEDLMALGERGLAEMEATGNSVAYYQWQAALARGLDQTLPSLRDANGGIGKSMAQIEAEYVDGMASQQQFFKAGHTPEALRDFFIDGQRADSLPVDYVHSYLAAALVDASPSDRPVIVSAMAEIQGAPKEAMPSISWELPDPATDGITQYINTTEHDGSADPYTAWREQSQGFNPEHGLAGLAIEKSVSDDPIWSGITDWNGSGGTYSASADVHRAAYFAQQAADHHQGDAGANTFSDED